MLISMVVPVYWNAETLPTLKQKFTEVAAQFPSDSFEFVFTDDGSGDNSFAVLTQLAADDARVRVLKLSRNFGSNAAMLAGLNSCQGDCAVVISADLQDPPERIPEMINHWKNGKEVVLAARRTRDDPIPGRWFADIFNYLFKRFVFPDFPDRGFDFMLIDRCVIDILVRLNEKNSYIFGQVMWAGFNRTVVYYDRRAREQGQSRWTFTKKVKYFIDAFSAFSYLPLRLATLIGFGMGLLGFLYTLVVIGLNLLNSVPIQGWSSLIVVVLVASGTQLILIGILGEYLWRVLDETRKRPPFIVHKMVNIPPDKGESRGGC
ncbi:MAG: glycosyltransferase family 2 protein [Anaerolineae bacterium]|nr:glycosyltransferase family 2 protein [Anaerolineae bacterium]